MKYSKDISKAMHRKTVLVTGGAGYIGSHTCVELLHAGYEVVVVDNLCNSHYQAIEGMERITGKKVSFIQADICDKYCLKEVFAQYSFDAVLHFAGLKAVGESVAKPLEYYSNNLNATLVLLECMKEYGINRLIFSSSATVYGNAQPPIPEDAPTGNCTNPYGWTKYMSEQIIRDYSTASKEFSGVLLRYFNPVGAHESGLIGENPRDIPNNLMPLIVQAARGERTLQVYGNDYDTPDGTCIRDYIHVMDLAEGHVAAMEYALEHSGVEAINLGTGRGCSVLELIREYERVNGVTVPYEMGPRRVGDAAASCAEVKKAKELLNWEAKRSMADMCRSAFLYGVDAP